MEISWRQPQDGPGVRFGTMRFDEPVLADLSWPVYDIVGATPGPRLCVMGGVHVHEASSLEAAMTLHSRIDPRDLAGTISVIPAVSQHALYKPFTPPDIENDLHWTYPGRAGGEFFEALAHALLFQWADDAEVLIDLHGGEFDEKMNTYVVVQTLEDPVFTSRALELAACFDCRDIVALAPAAALERGRCCTGLAQVGRLAIVAERGDQGTADKAAIDWHRDGVFNVARWLGMLSGSAPAPSADHRVFDRYEWIKAPVEGIVERRFEPGQTVRSGTAIGAITDLFGAPKADIKSPADGVVMMCRTGPTAAAGGLLGSIGLAASSLTGS